MEVQSPWLYRLIQTLARGASYIYAPATVLGREHIPATGPVIIVANHLSYIDPVLIGGLFPRPIVFMAKKELWENAIVGRALTAIGVVPVDRRNAAVSTARAAMRALRNGDPVTLFPEGTRSYDGQVQPFKTGFLKLARRTSAPVLPCGVAGTWEIWPRHRKVPRPGRITIAFGELMDVASLCDRDTAEPDLEALAGDVRERVLALMAQHSTRR